MTRHLIDHPEVRRNSRLVRFARIERRLGGTARHRFVALRQLPRALKNGVRFKRFLAMERADN